MATKPLRDYAKRGAFDEIDTPASAVEYLIPTLKRYESSYPLTIWESAPPPDRQSTLFDTLWDNDFRVTAFKGMDYFENSPTHYDMQVTNPPYSLKQQWVARAMELGKPWALLLPITALGVRKGGLNVHLSRCRVLLPPRRIDYTGKKAPWFFSAWFTYGIGHAGLVPVDDEGRRV